MKIFHFFKKEENKKNKEIEEKKEIQEKPIDPIFIEQCKTQEDRNRNEMEVDYLYKSERNRYMKKMMLEFLKNELKYKEEEVLKSDFYDFFECIVDDLIEKAKNAKLPPKVDSNMHYIGDGFSVICFRIGENVITIGRYKDHNIDFVPDENLLNLKLNRTFEVENKNGEKITIQVMPYVDTHNVTEEELYQIYRHFRLKGYVWLDCKKQNIGHLLNPNVNPYPDLSEEGRTFLGIHEVTDTVLEKGSPVIFDIDGIVPENILQELDWPVKRNQQYKKLEKRYQKEMEKKS